MAKDLQLVEGHLIDHDAPDVVNLDTAFVFELLASRLAPPVAHLLDALRVLALDA